MAGTLGKWVFQNNLFHRSVLGNMHGEREAFRGSCSGECKCKGRLAILAFTGDVLLVAIQNGFDNIQPQSHTVPVLAAGVVCLVKAVKNQGHLFRRDGLSLITDGLSADWKT